ncbi:MAG TPA: DUF72 domain-containing protein [Candidatus Saccharimonadaceae bacterium]|nr:DUF72 domain-containing protein [Candidatus Saccharimonadaceae bacterium]
MSAEIRIGTQGWAYPDWLGAFYPPGAKQQDLLPFYAEVFDTVELDTTFYGAPKPAIARSWEKRVPAGFRFAAKLPRAITHDALLRDAAPEFAEFLRALEPLGAKLGPLLAQMPAEFERTTENVAALRAFARLNPKDAKLAIEFRHASWHVPETWATLRELGLAVAWTSWRVLPHVSEVTADFLYLRWLGDRRDVTVFDRVQIDRSEEFAAWEPDVRRALPEVREVYGYFNNHWAGHSPASANEMKERLGLVAVDPKARWRQGEMW